MATEKAKRIIASVSIYMLASYVLSYLSPSRFVFKQPVFLTILVLSYIFAFSFGAYLGINRQSKREDRILYPNDTRTGLKVCLIILLGYTIISMLKNMVATGASNLGSALVMSMSNAKDVYYAKGGLDNGPLLNFITILLSPVFVYASLFGLLRIKSFSNLYKIVYALFIAFEIFRWMFVGTNKGIFDVVILLIVGLAFFKDSDITKKGINLKQLLIIIAFSFLAIWVFAYTMQSRLGEQYYLIQNVGKYPLNYNHFLFKLFPDEIVILIIRFIDYIVQGYYGLSLGLTLDWKPTFLAGSNTFLQGYIQPFLSFNVVDRLYQTRIERLFDWGATSNWHTMYLWLANDFSFPGVVFIMGVIGFLLGECLFDGLEKHNPYGLCLAYLLIKAMFYSSANNQILGTYSIVTVLFFYLLWKKDKIIRFRLRNNF